MATRIVGEKGALFTAGKNYSKFRPCYPSSLFDTIHSFGSFNESKLAVDIGCGTGQVSNILAELFTTVIAVDPSSSQIEAAKSKSQKDNVQYFITAGENLHMVDDNSVDLVTIAQTV